MKRFKNILYLADPEGNGNTAFQHAASLAKRNMARIKAVIVLEPPPKGVGKKLRKKHSLDIQKVLVQKYTDKLEKLVAPLNRAGLRTDTRVFFGDPFIEVIREILRHKHDLVITAARLRSGMKEVFFGSTTMHLMRKCPSPLWVIKPTRHKTFTRVLAAIDPIIEDDTAHRQENSLNVKILELASALSEMWGGDLHIISAWTIYGESPAQKRRGHLVRGVPAIPPGDEDRAPQGARGARGKARAAFSVRSGPPSQGQSRHGHSEIREEPPNRRDRHGNALQNGPLGPLHWQHGGEGPGRREVLRAHCETGGFRLSRQTALTLLLRSPAFGRSEAPLIEDDTHEARAARRAWARLIKKIYEVDPMLSSECGFATRLLAFIEEEAVIRKIQEHLKLWEDREPMEYSPGPPLLSREASTPLVLSDSLFHYGHWGVLRGG